MPSCPERNKYEMYYPKLNRVHNKIGCLWVGKEIFSGEVVMLLSTNCLQDLCICDTIDVNLEVDSDTQYAFNHAGRLCGECRDEYSIAI